MDLQRPKCDFNDFPEAPDWAVCVIDNGVHSAFCEEFDYMARAQWLGGVEFRVSNPTNFTVIASRNEPCKPEWDGEGLPPVGCRVEANYGGEWAEVTVAYTERPESHGDAVAWREALVFDCKTTRPFWADEFRPIRSEADKKKEEAIFAIAELCRGSASNGLSAELIYDAIKSGKIVIE